MVILGVVSLVAACGAFVWRSGEFTGGVAALKKSIGALEESIRELTSATNKNTVDVARLTGRIDGRDEPNRRHPIP
jgi:hypothetical protein